MSSDERSDVSAMRAAAERRPSRAALRRADAPTSCARAGGGRGTRVSQRRRALARPRNARRARLEQLCAPAAGQAEERALFEQPAERDRRQLAQHKLERGLVRGVDLLVGDRLLLHLRAEHQVAEREPVALEHGDGERGRPQRAQQPLELRLRVALGGRRGAAGRGARAELGGRRGRERQRRELPPRVQARLRGRSRDEARKRRGRARAPRAREVRLVKDCAVRAEERARAAVHARGRGEAAVQQRAAARRRLPRVVLLVGADHISQLWRPRERLV